jgi:NAD(P)H-dependent FMN reductase
MNIVIVSASVRAGRVSHRVALFFKQYIEENKIASVTVLDLHQYQFPVFDERLKFQKNPTPQMLEVSHMIKSADGVLIVTPEYNGGYPASLKNLIDLLTDEWRRKPVAISTVSDGSFGGTQVITSLQFTLWKMKAWTVPAMFPVPKAPEAFDEQGHPADKASAEKRAKSFIGELVWCMSAKSKMGV